MTFLLHKRWHSLKHALINKVPPVVTYFWTEVKWRDYFREIFHCKLPKPHCDNNSCSLHFVTISSSLTWLFFYKGDAHIVEFFFSVLSGIKDNWHNSCIKITGSWVEPSNHKWTNQRAWGYRTCALGHFLYKQHGQDGQFYFNFRTKINKLMFFLGCKYTVSVFEHTNNFKFQYTIKKMSAKVVPTWTFQFLLKRWSKPNV